MTSFSWYVPDTHTVAWHFLEDPQLSPLAKDVMRGAELGDCGLVVPTIVLAELQGLYERRMPRIPIQRIVRRFNDLSTVVIAPFDWDIFREFQTLPTNIELHDRIIAATSRIFTAPLVSKDRVLAGFMETVW